MGYVKQPQVLIPFDIETVSNPVTQEDIDLYMASWEPPKNVTKAETMLAHREKALKEAPEAIAKSRAFSIDGKRCISLAMGLVSGDSVSDIVSFAGDDISIIGTGFAHYLNEFKGSRIRLVGWNSEKFDLPEIIKVMHMSGAYLETPISKWDNIDLCVRPFRGMSLKTTAKAFGLPQMEGADGPMDGSSVQGLYDAGDWDAIRKYNEHDVYLTGMLAIAASRLIEL